MKLETKSNMDIENKIDALLAEMSLAEKLGQLNQLGTPVAKDVETFRTKIREGEIGSVLMAVSATAGNDAQGAIDVPFYDELQRIAVEESRLGIPLLFGRDVIHGHHTVYPIPLALAASFDNDMIEKCYRNIASEAANEAIHWSFTPMLDVSRDPRWGRCVEGPGEDPYVGEQMARSVVRGLQGNDLSAPESIVACAKHYIGYGASEGGRDYHHTEIVDHSLRNYYLRAFKSAIDSGVQTVMNSFNEIGGQPTVSSRYLLTDVLRNELGFDGFVIADYNSVIQQIAEGTATDEKDAAEQAINAGVDMDMVDECFVKHLESSVADGAVTMNTIDEAVRRILRVKFRAGLFENPYSKKNDIDKQEHDRDARTISSESIVLLKNQNGILPLRKNARIALMGPMAEEKTTMLGSWALDGKAEDVVSIAEGLKAGLNGGKVYHKDNCLTDEQLMNIRFADATVVAIGESRAVTGEYNSVASIEVRQEHIDLLRRAKRAGKPVIAILCYGRPVALEELEPYCDAILYAWHLGTQAGNAIADVLFGDVNPSGKLPMTLPRMTGQIPLYYNAPASTHEVNGYYGQGRSYHDCPCTPMYPFGYGLSYTEFAFENLRVSQTEIPLENLLAGEKIKVIVTVGNIGKADGEEIVQLYIRDKVATFVRPLRELKGYKKVAIEGGKSETVTLEIGAGELSYYCGKVRTVEKGTFEIYVGNSCYAPLAATIRVM